MAPGVSTLAITQSTIAVKLFPARHLNSSGKQRKRSKVGGMTFALWGSVDAMTKTRLSAIGQVENSPKE